MADPYKFLSGLGQAHLARCISILFGYDEQMLQFFFSHKEPVLRMPARCLVEEAAAFSSCDQLLIRTALDFWNRRGYARLSDMLTDWEHEHWVRFIHAVSLLKEMQHDAIDALNSDGITPYAPGTKKLKKS